MLRLLEAQTSPVRAVSVVVIVVIPTTVVAPFAAVLCEILDESTLGEVMSVSLVDLAPAGLLGPSAGFPLTGGFGWPSADKTVTAFLVFFLALGLLCFGESGSSGRPAVRRGSAPINDPNLRLVKNPFYRPASFQGKEVLFPDPPRGHYARAP